MATTKEAQLNPVSVEIPEKARVLNLRRQSEIFYFWIVWVTLIVCAPIVKMEWLSPEAASWLFVASIALFAVTISIPIELIRFIIGFVLLIVGIVVNYMANALWSFNFLGTTWDFIDGYALPYDPGPFAFVGVVLGLLWLVLTVFYWLFMTVDLTSQEAHFNEFGSLSVKNITGSWNYETDLKSDTLKLIFGFGAGTIRITGDNGDAVAEDVIFLAPMRKRVNRVRRVRDVK